MRIELEVELSIGGKVANHRSFERYKRTYAKYLSKNVSFLSLKLANSHDLHEDQDNRTTTTEF